jgi:hypothetical protein
LLTISPNVANMAKKRIRIDIEDAEGANFNLNLTGNITREKVLKAFELLDLMDIENNAETPPKLDSLGAKIWHIVDKFFPTGKFTSSEILEKYEDEYNEPVTLSKISVYLSRFSGRGKIERARTGGREWTYQCLKITQKRPN